MFPQATTSSPFAVASEIATSNAVAANNSTAHSHQPPVMRDVTPPPEIRPAEKSYTFTKDQLDRYVAETGVGPLSTLVAKLAQKELAALGFLDENHVTGTFDSSTLVALKLLEEKEKAEKLGFLAGFPDSVILHFDKLASWLQELEALLDEEWGEGFYLPSEEQKEILDEIAGRLRDDEKGQSQSKLAAEL